MAGSAVPSGMDLHGWIAVGTLGAAAVLFVTKWLPIGVTALAIPVVLVVTGVIENPSDALTGFGSQAVITIGSIFVVGAALQESGVATLMARGLQRLGGGSEVWLIGLVMIGAALLSAIMNNAAAVALLLPAVVTLARRSLLPTSRLLMPMAFATVLGGTVTLIGTAPNLLLADEIRQRIASGLVSPDQSIGVFTFALAGVPIVVTGILYMILVGRRLIPFRTAEDRLREARLPEEVAQSYGLLENLFQMRVVGQSLISGKTVAEASLRTRYGLSLVMVVRAGAIGSQRYLHPRADLVLEPEDRLYLQGEEVDAWSCAETEVLQFGLAGPQTIERMLGRGMTLTEVSVPPRSQAVGRNLTDMEFRRRYHGNVLLLWRRGKTIKQDATREPLEVGDVFLVSGNVQGTHELMRNPDFNVLTDPSAVEDVQHAPLAIGILLVAILPPILGIVEIPISALAAALMMVVSGCISMPSLRRAVDWKVLALDHRDHPPGHGPRRARGRGRRGRRHPPHRVRDGVRRRPHRPVPVGRLRRHAQHERRGGRDRGARGPAGGGGGRPRPSTRGAGRGVWLLVRLHAALRPVESARHVARRLPGRRLPEGRAGPEPRHGRHRHRCAGPPVGLALPAPRSRSASLGVLGTLSFPPLGGAPCPLAWVFSPSCSPS